MGRDYIPESDLKAAIWMKVFAARLVDFPELYRISPADALAVQEAVTAFRIAHIRARDPRTRTSPAIAGRREARKAAEKLLRPVAQRIRTDPAIDTAAKVNLGLKLIARRRQRVRPPQSALVVFGKGQPDGGVLLVVHDSQSHRTGKPPATIGLELYEHIALYDADAPSLMPAPVARGATNAEISGWRYLGLFTESRMRVYPGLAGRGGYVTFAARWISRRGEAGPFKQSSRVVMAAAEVFGPSLRRAG